MAIVLNRNQFTELPLHACLNRLEQIALLVISERKWKEEQCGLSLLRRYQHSRILQIICAVQQRIFYMLQLDDKQERWMIFLFY